LALRKLIKKKKKIREEKKLKRQEDKQAVLLQDTREKNEKNFVL
jgi:hypothetical protein